MPWVTDSGTEYRLCLLDTNALGSIVEHRDTFGRAFIQRFPPSDWVPCWTIYNVIELRRAPERLGLYDAWLDFFSEYPSFLLEPYSRIVAAEVAAYHQYPAGPPLLNAFTLAGSDDRYFLRPFLEKLFAQDWMIKLEAGWRDDENDTLRAWVSRSNDNRKADQYVSESAVAHLTEIHPSWMATLLNAGGTPDVNRFPALQIMLYSQFYRIREPGRVHEASDVTDVRIMAAAPYVEAVVTEKFQAEVFRKTSEALSSIAQLDVVKVGELCG